MYNDFYLGEFTYRGIRYSGKHQPLFSWIEIQRARNRSEEKGLFHSTKDKKDKFLFKKLPFYCMTDKTRITAELKKKYYKRTPSRTRTLIYFPVRSIITEKISVRIFVSVSVN